MEINTRYPVQCENEVAWGEQDALGHVNNTVYFRYFENARIRHFLAMGMPMPQPGNQAEGPILASTRCDFLRPLTYPDRVRTEIGVSRIGTSSFTHLYRIYSISQQTWVARGESVTVYYDYVKGTSTPLPTELRRSLLVLEGVHDGSA